MMYSMRLAATFSTLILAAPTPQAAPPKPSAYIWVTKSQTCYIGEAGFSCKAFTEKLKELHVNPADRVEVMGDPHVGLKAIAEVTDLLQKAGYLNVLAFYEK